jgi:hypothetical protein
LERPANRRDGLIDLTRTSIIAASIKRGISGELQVARVHVRA